MYLLSEDNATILNGKTLVKYLRLFNKYPLRALFKDKMTNDVQEKIREEIYFK